MSRVWESGMIRNLIFPGDSNVQQSLATTGIMTQATLKSDTDYANR